MAFYLSSGQMRQVRVNKPDYEWAVETVQGVPWAALAGLHYRENEFGRVMHGEEAECGPFALDPGGTGMTLRDRILAYVGQVCRLYRVPVKEINEDFPTAALVAAYELKSKAIGPLQDEGGGLHLDILADAFWGYNGRSKYHTPTGEPDQSLKSWRYSPYVSNDPLNGVTFQIRGSIPDASVEGGRRHIHTPDKRPGALVVYQEIMARAGELAA